MDSFFPTYIDDIITGSHSKKSCQDTSRQVDAGVNYLRHQDSAWNRRTLAKRPGDWVGAMFFSDEAYGVYMTFSQDKLYKGKHFVEVLYNHVFIGGNNILDRKGLEKSVGFLVHLSHTFPALLPYFKGIYFTM